MLRLATFALVCAAVACDKDPVRSDAVFALTACPGGAGGRLSVNDPIVFTFTEPVLASSVANGNIVVSDARTGQEIQGSVTLADTTGMSVRFTPAAALPFDRALRIRVQNLLNRTSDAGIGVTVCEASTAFAPIRELFWNALSPAGGNDLLGVSLVGTNAGFVISRAVTLFKSTGTDFTLIAAPPQYSGSYDVSFVDPLRGFASFEDQRRQRVALTQTLDGGITFDTLYSTRRAQNRLYFRRVGPAATDIFGVVGIGFGSDGGFAKVIPTQPNNNTVFQTFANTGTTNDIDFGTDTVRGVGVTLGVRLGTFIRYGRVYYTNNGGTFWTEVPGSQASDRTLTYRGVAVQGDTTVYVVGGNGFAARYVRNADGSLGARTVFRPDSGSTGFEGPRLVSVDSTNPDALVFNDVQFDATNPSIGFIIGAQLVGNVGGVPRYQGLIFETRDGGRTWRRQGVRGGPNNGAEFPRLNRLSLFRASPTAPLTVWAVGDAGYVTAFTPCAIASQTPTQQSNGDIACK